MTHLLRHGTPAMTTPDHFAGDVPHLKTGRSPHPPSERVETGENRQVAKDAKDAKWDEKMENRTSFSFLFAIFASFASLRFSPVSTRNTPGLF